MYILLVPVLKLLLMKMQNPAGVPSHMNLLTLSEASEQVSGHLIHAGAFH